MYLLKFCYYLDDVGLVWDSCVLSGKPNKKKLSSIILGILSNDFGEDFKLGSLSGVYLKSFNNFVSIPVITNDGDYVFQFMLCSVNVVDV